MIEKPAPFYAPPMMQGETVDRWPRPVWLALVSAALWPFGRTIAPRFIGRWRPTPGGDSITRDLRQIGWRIARRADDADQSDLDRLIKKARI